MTEVELAQAVVSWLTARGWTVYQEVEIARGGRRCDVVAVRGHRLWAIECKTAIGLAVLEQAHRWLRHAHRVSAATGRSRSDFAARVARDYGIGWLVVNRGRRRAVRELVEPAERARVSQRLRRRLSEPQRTFAPAGNARAQFWSPWKATVREVQDWVAAHPGGAFAEMVGQVRHHYRTAATARSCLRQHIGDGLVPGVELERAGRRLVLVARLHAVPGREPPLLAAPLGQAPVGPGGSAAPVDQRLAAIASAR
jgi:hypothetical protein